MRRILLLVLWVSSGLTLAQPPPEGERSPLHGFFAAESRQQREWENRFEELVQAANIGNWIERMAARPHHVGSPYGKENAEWIAEQFSAWGYRTEIEVFDVLFTTNKKRLLEMLEPSSFQAGLSEPAIPQDAASGQSAERLPGYNAYSADGDVSGELVYVNYGVPADYEELQRRGIDVRGKIVIARYGGSWRGIKPKVAAQNGALGCILYSDPRDDGYFRGDVYPEGPFRMEHGVQRGSVADMPIFPGDPLTPGVGAVTGVARLPREDAPTLARIPVLPISYADALPLIRALGGPVAPPSWRGALPVTYHLGPGPAKVRLALEFNWDLVPAYNVIARLAGSERPDQWIVRGNHHDAWVNGAADPVSGMAAMMEEARAVAKLVELGWQPRRTIVYAAWDAEEPGLIGSTEWAEHHAEELREKVAVYINSDSNGRGFLGAGGSHGLERLVNEVAREVTDPQTGVSVWERLRARRLSTANPPQADRIRSRADLAISALGSGSDYSPFLQHLGIASLNLGFGGENAGGSYHSAYDSFDHYSRFGDPGFVYGATQAKTVGRAVLRLAAASVLPWRFSNLAETIKGYSGEVADLADQMRRRVESHNLDVAQRVHILAADPREKLVPPSKKEPVPFLNFAPLRNAVRRLESLARSCDDALKDRLRSPQGLPPAAQRALDRIFMLSERALTRIQGLPGRQWYVHYIYAPGLYTGYGVKTLPAIREAIEQEDWVEAEQQIALTASVLDTFSERLEAAAALLEAPGSDRE